jgi:alpha-L-glutamate ligase-like protein
MFEYLVKSRKVLGMNSRNLRFIRPSNRKSSKRIADDKLLCKRVLTKNGVPVPRLITKIRTLEELENFDWKSLPDSFALKPNRGFGGEGILVVYGKRKNAEDVWIKADRSTVKIEDLKNHIRNILDGSFSLSNIPDIAFFEERLQLLKLFKPYCFKGIPDIRVIVYNKVPVMAMLRLPTKESQGKANLQQGAIGVGIDLARGVTTSAVQGKNRMVELVPDSRLLLSGLKIPFWQDILRLAVKAQEITNLGFLGADIAIDKERGPVVLELNARPGLSIQIANLSGLKERLMRVMGLTIKNPERGVRVGMDLFGGEIEEELEDISGKKVIGSTEKVKLFGKEGKVKEVEAKIDTGAYSSSIDRDLAIELGYGLTIETFEKINLSEFELKPEKESAIKKKIMAENKDSVPELSDVAVVFSSHGASIRPVIKITMVLDDIEVIASCNIADRKELKHSIIVGKRNLGKFLIDVNK